MACIKNVNAKNPMKRRPKDLNRHSKKEYPDGQ